MKFMSHGKSTFIVWRCGDCNKPHKVTAYNKREDANIVKELSMFCNQCRKHTMHKRKDASSGKKKT